MALRAKYILFEIPLFFDSPCTYLHDSISTYLHLRLVSGSCSDLVRRCLALRPQNRISLDQILRSVDFQDLWSSRLTYFSHIQASLDHFLRTLGAPLLYNHDEGGVISGAAETVAWQETGSPSSPLHINRQLSWDPHWCTCALYVLALLAVSRNLYIVIHLHLYILDRLKICFLQ